MKKIIFNYFAFVLLFLMPNVSMAASLYSNSYDGSASHIAAGINGAVMAFGLGVIALVCHFLFKLMKSGFNKAKEGTKRIIEDNIDNIPEKLVNISIIKDKLVNEPDSSYYGQAEQEINDGTFDKGLWAKALVNVKGNEGLRKIEYIKIRAKQLQKIEYEQQKIEELQKIEIQKISEHKTIEQVYSELQNNEEQQQNTETTIQTTSLTDKCRQLGLQQQNTETTIRATASNNAFDRKTIDFTIAVLVISVLIMIYAVLSK